MVSTFFICLFINYHHYIEKVFMTEQLAHSETVKSTDQQVARVGRDSGTHNAALLLKRHRQAGWRLRAPLRLRQCCRSQSDQVLLLCAVAALRNYYC